MSTWTKMKASISHQMHSDPQRATLSQRAVVAVEEGLRHLESVGHQFEIAPKGTLAELIQTREEKPLALPLSIDDAVEQIAGPKKPPIVSKFEAMIPTNSEPH